MSLCVAGAMLLPAGLVTLVVPNAVHVSIKDVGQEVFFDCGGALYPGTRPAEEPGISACEQRNDGMLAAGSYLVSGGAAALLVGLWSPLGILWRPKRQ